MKLKSRQSQATTAETDKIVLLKSWLTLNIFLYENKTKQINSGVVCAKVRFHFDNDRFTMFSLKKTIQKKNYDVINCYKLSRTSIDSLVDSTKQTIIINFNWCRDKTKCNKCTNLRLAVIILALETDLFYLFGQLIECRTNCYIYLRCDKYIRRSVCLVSLIWTKRVTYFVFK